jgi:N-acetylglucosamine kinase-like BadF-type ATPase
MLAAHDLQQRDLLTDGLLEAFGMDHPHAVALLIATGDPREWASVAPVVFDCAERGSLRAQRVVEAHAQALVDLVRVVEYRGGDITTIVAGGGVLLNQPLFYSRLEQIIHESFTGELSVSLLQVPAALGAVKLARTLHGTPIRSDIRTGAS